MQRPGVCYNSTMTDKDFTKNFLSYVKKGDTILDVGAGMGIYSQMFVDKGALVTAVDIKVPEDLGGSIVCKKMSVEEYVAREQGVRFDMVFMRNILQFLDKQWTFETLFPWLEEHLNKNGMIGIETFYREPEPAFPIRSVYTTHELVEQFVTWQDLYLEQYEYTAPDMRGISRRFFISDVIVRRG